MGIIENFKKLGYRFTSTQQKVKSKRKALGEIHTVLCSIDTGEPTAMQQKFEKIDVARYSDAQVNRIFNDIVTLSKQIK